MPQLGVPELLIILFIVLIIFGAGRLTDIGRELGRGMRELRHMFREDKQEAESKPDQAHSDSRV